MRKEYILIDPALSLTDLAAYCTQAIENNIEQLTVPPLLIQKTSELLINTHIRVGALIGYPYGWNIIESKLAETIMAMVDGAAELELYINLTALKNNDWQYLAKELNTILTLINKQQKLLNILLDPRWTTDTELVQCCDLYGIAGINCFSLISEAGGNMDNQLTLVRSHIADAIEVRAVGLDYHGEIGGVTRYGKIVK
jgi:deoxyribose-phosphate aldolase